MKLTRITADRRPAEDLPGPTKHYLKSDCLCRRHLKPPRLRKLPPDESWLQECGSATDGFMQTRSEAAIRKKETMTRNLDAAAAFQHLTSAGRRISTKVDAISWKNKMLLLREQTDLFSPPDVLRGKLKQPQL